MSPYELAMARYEEYRRQQAEREDKKMFFEVLLNNGAPINQEEALTPHDFKEIAEAEGLSAMSLAGFILNEEGQLLLIDEGGNMAPVNAEGNFIIRICAGQMRFDIPY